MPAHEPSKPRRRPGKPKRGERAVTPEVLEGIGIKWLQGISVCAIGRHFGIDESTVRHHLDKTILPEWREAMRSRLPEDLAKVALIERTAWERFHSAEPGETRESIEKALLEGGRRPQLVKQAISKVTRTGDVAWLQVIQWCLDFRARIHAHYAPARHKVDLGGELRVAGQTPSEVDQAMLDRLMERIMERRRHRQALDPGEN